MPLANKTMASYPFLAEMYDDDYFPNALVDKGKAILVRLCERIEADTPQSLDDLYALTHAATEEFNDLAAEFEEEDSEIETAARDAIGGDFAAIEELIAARDW